MDIIRKTIGENVFVFYCDSGDTRHGFKHEVELYKNGRYIASNKSYYLNRTWEKYRYQTCMLGAISNRQAQLEHDFIEEYKAQKSIKRLTKAKREDALNMLNNTKEYAEIKALRELVKNADYGTDEEREQLEFLDRMLTFAEAFATLRRQ